MTAIAPTLPRHTTSFVITVSNLFSSFLQPEVSHHQTSLSATPAISTIPLSLRLSDEIERYREECAYPNWDAYDAEPLLPVTIENAQAFLDKLPDALHTPEAFVDPGGELFFEWSIENYRTVAFINQLGRISYSITKGDDTTFGYGYLPEIPSELVAFLSTHFSH